MERDERRISGASGDPISCETCRSLILDYVEGVLHAAAARQVETHVAGCPVCRLELALAQQIESALARRELRMPPADFTVRVLSALPAARTAGGGFWSRMLVPMAYAVSIPALLLGLGRGLRDPSGFAGVWSDPVSMLPRILDMGWLVPSLAPSRLEGFFRTAMGVAGDALASVTAMSEPLRGLYSANAPVIHLTLAALALLWVLYDDRQEAKE